MTVYRSEKTVFDSLEKRFAPPEWVLLPHVSNGTGSSISRYLDGVALNIWASRGLEIHGFEIKVSRGDWLNELKNPEKAETMTRLVDRFWIVAGDRKLVKLEELPKQWGLLVPRGGGWETRRYPEDTKPGKSWDRMVTRAFMAAFVRRAVEGFIPRGQYQRQITIERAAMRADVEKERDENYQRQQKKWAENEKKWNALEKFFGIDFDWLDADHLIKRVSELHPGLRKVDKALESIQPILPPHVQEMGREDQIAFLAQMTQVLPLVARSWGELCQEVAGGFVHTDIHICYIPCIDWFGRIHTNVFHQSHEFIPLNW